MSGQMTISEDFFVINSQNEVYRVIACYSYGWTVDWWLSPCLGGERIVIPTEQFHKWLSVPMNEVEDFVSGKKGYSDIILKGETDE